MEQLWAQHGSSAHSAARSFDETLQWVRDISRGKHETADKKCVVWVELQKRPAKGKAHPNIDVCLKMKGQGCNEQVLSTRATEEEHLFPMTMTVLGMAMCVSELDYSKLRDDGRTLLLPLLDTALDRMDGPVAS